MVTVYGIILLPNPTIGRFCRGQYAHYSFNLRLIPGGDQLTAEQLLWHTTEHTRCGSLIHLITHENDHHGQINYLRGTQVDAKDLTRGIRVVLP